MCRKASVSSKEKLNLSYYSEGSVMFFVSLIKHKDELNCHAHHFAPLHGYLASCVSPSLVKADRSFPLAPNSTN